MNEIFVMLVDFWKRQLSRFVEKNEDGWDGWETISEKEYRERAIRNMKAGDYIDAANLCVLADFARKVKVSKVVDKHKTLSHE